MITIGVKGMVGLLQSLTRGKRVAAHVQRVVAAEGEKLADAIRSAAPVEHGALRESVRTEPADEEPGIVVAAGGPTTTDERGYDHALGVEFGTRKMPAQPFFYPTIRDRKRAIERAIGKAAEDAAGEG